jgi:3-hydroxyisobutyrate dehydrogenase-like beta-hydroxyacid dehydrogenase
VSVIDDPRPPVGLIGLGNMGSAFAERLLDAGFELFVHSRTPERAKASVARGAVAADSVAALAQKTNVIVTSLPNDSALESVAAEIAATARQGTILVDTSTVSPASSGRVAEMTEGASLGYLRAPVSGNPAVVRAGNLTFIVSGPTDVLERAEPILRALGSTIHVVGDLEQARLVKLAINLVIAGLAELMAEALVLAESAGVSREALLHTMGDSAAGAPFVKYKTEPLLRDDYSATFTTALMEKDLDLVLDAAGGAGLALPLASELKQLLHATIESGYADLDFMALFLRLRSASDQEVLR